MPEPTATPRDVANCTFNVSGDVTWGTAIASTNSIAATPGSTSWTSTLTAPYHGNWIALYNVFDVHGTQLFGATNDPNGVVGQSYTLTHPTDPGTFSVATRLWAGRDNTGPLGQFSGALQFTPCNPFNPTPCAYGTELQPTATFFYYLTPGLIDTWLAAVGMPWLAPLFTALWFTNFNAQTLCSSGPPPFPTIDLSTLEAGITTVREVLNSVAWPNVCQCKPGSPSPTPFPPPSAPEPAGWPVLPTFSCSNTDPCALLLQLQQQVAQLQAAVGETLGLTTLYQRYELPFGYIEGAVHPSRGGEGSFEVSRLLGFKINVVARPEKPELPSVTPYVWDLGWMSVLDANGFIEERRVTRDVQLWFPRIAADATIFGYSLKDGVAITITELEAEP